MQHMYELAPRAESICQLSRLHSLDYVFIAAHTSYINNNVDHKQYIYIYIVSVKLNFK